MSSVDDRVVNMQFNNAQFNNGAQETMSLLDKLKQKLELPNSKPSLDMSGVNSAIDGSGSKFSALQTIAIGALLRIGETAVDIGAKITKALTIQPALDGFNEYELQINSLRTIAANLPNETNDNINKTLDELNHYADQTIYSFADMTRAMGLFSAAGVDLQRSQKAIEGLSNIAAGSGANNAALTRAEYQVSQALQQGYFNLMDWRSVENAGMASPEFRENLKATAKEFGVDVDSMIQTYGSFDHSLSKSKWLTSDIFLATLDKASDKTTEWGARLYEAATKISSMSQLVDTIGEEIGSGWGSSFKTIFGDLVEARELFTGIYDVLDPIISASADFRNNILNTWDQLGGRAALLSTDGGALFRMLDTIKTIADSASKALLNVFSAPYIQGKRLTDFSKRIQDGAMAIQIVVKQNAYNILKIFRGIFSIFDIGVKIINTVVGGFKRLIQAASPTPGTFFDAAGSVGDFFYQLDRMNSVVQVVSKGIDWLVDRGIRFINAFKDIAGQVGSMLSPLKTGLSSLFKGIVQGLKSSDLGSSIASVFDSFVGSMPKKFESVTETIKDFFQAFADGVDQSKVASTTMDLVNGFLDHIANIGGTVKNALSGIGDAFKKMFGVLIDFGDQAAKSFDFSKFMDLLSTIGKVLLAGGLGSSLVGTVTSMKSIADGVKDLASGFSGIKDDIVRIFKRLGDVFEKWKQQVNANMIKSVAVAVGILTASLVVMSALDSNKLVSGLMGLTIVVQIMMNVIEQLNNLQNNGADVGKISKSMVILSIAIGILAGSLRRLAKMDWESLAKGVVGIAALFTIVGAFLKVMSSGEATKAIQGAGGLILVAVAIKLLVGSVKALGSMDYNTIEQGVLGLTALMGIVAAFVSFTSGAKNMVSIGAGVLIMAAGIRVLVGAVQDFASMDPDKLSQGLTALGYSLTVVSLAFLAVQNANPVAAGAGLLIAAVGLKVIANVVSQLGSIDLDAMTQGLIGISVALVAVVAATNLMPKDGISAAGSILAISVALLVLTKVIQGIGSMDTGQLIQGMIGMAVALGIVIGAAYLAAPIAPILLTLGEACALLGSGMFLAGAGLALFATGLGMLVGVASLGVSALTLALSTLITAVGNVVDQLIEVIIDGIIKLINTLADRAQDIINAVVNLITTIASIIGPMIGPLFTDYIFPAIGQALTDLWNFILNGITGFFGTVWDAIVNAFTTWGTQLGEFIMEFGNGSLNQAIANLIFMLLGFLANGLLSIAAWVAEKLGDLAQIGVDIINGIVYGLNSVSTLILDTLTNLINGAVQGIKDFLGGFIDIGSNIVSNIIQGISQMLTDLLNKGREMIDNVINGVNEKIVNIGDYGRDLIGKFIDGVKSGFSNLGKIGQDMVNGIANGVSGAAKNLVDSAVNMARNAVNAVKDVLQIGSPSKVMRRFGQWSVQGGILGLNDEYDNLMNAVDNLLSGALSSLDDNQEFHPSISPVLNLSELQNGSAAIASLLGSNPTMPLSASIPQLDMANNRMNSLESMIFALRQDMHAYTDAVMSRPQYSWQMGDSIINDDEQIRSDFIALINDLTRRADMYRG